jgi:hypothetical protein
LVQTIGIASRHVVACQDAFNGTLQRSPTQVSADDTLTEIYHHGVITIWHNNLPVCGIRVRRGATLIVPIKVIDT